MSGLRGLPGPLPAEERLLWQGGPEWRTLARSALHVRKLAVYFGAIAVWVAVSGTVRGAGAGDTGLALLRAVGLAAVPLGLAVLYAWAVSRATVYTITNRRVVLHVGLALPVTMNVPFASVHAADLKQGAGGTGDISLRLEAGKRLSWIVLWPHVRAWRMAQPEPTLRALADVAAVARTLGRALAASADMAAPVLARPADVPEGALHVAEAA